MNQAPPEPGEDTIAPNGNHDGTKTSTKRGRPSNCKGAPATPPVAAAAARSTRRNPAPEEALPFERQERVKKFRSAAAVWDSEGEEGLLGGGGLDVPPLCAAGGDDPRDEDWSPGKKPAGGGKGKAGDPRGKKARAEGKRGGAAAGEAGPAPAASGLLEGDARADLAAIALQERGYVVSGLLSPEDQLALAMEEVKAQAQGEGAATAGAAGPSVAPDPAGTQRKADAGGGKGKKKEGRRGRQGGRDGGAGKDVAGQAREAGAPSGQDPAALMAQNFGVAHRGAAQETPAQQQLRQYHAQMQRALALQLEQQRGTDTRTDVDRTAAGAGPGPGAYGSGSAGPSSVPLPERHQGQPVVTQAAGPAGPSPSAPTPSSGAAMTGTGALGLPGPALPQPPSQQPAQPQDFVRFQQHMASLRQALLSSRIVAPVWLFYLEEFFVTSFLSQGRSNPLITVEASVSGALQSMAQACAQPPNAATLGHLLPVLQGQAFQAYAGAMGHWIRAIEQVQGPPGIQRLVLQLQFCRERERVQLSQLHQQAVQFQAQVELQRAQAQQRGAIAAQQQQRGGATGGGGGPAAGAMVQGQWGLAPSQQQQQQQRMAPSQYYNYQIPQQQQQQLEFAPLRPPTTARQSRGEPGGQGGMGAAAGAGGLLSPSPAPPETTRDQAQQAQGGGEGYASEGQLTALQLQEAQQGGAVEKESVEARARAHGIDVRNPEVAQYVEMLRAAHGGRDAVSMEQGLEIAIREVERYRAHQIIQMGGVVDDTSGTS